MQSHGTTSCSTTLLFARPGDQLKIPIMPKEEEKADQELARESGALIFVVLQECSAVKSGMYARTEYILQQGRAI